MRRGSAAAVVAAVAVLAAGCGSSDDSGGGSGSKEPGEKDPGKAALAEPWHDGIKPASAAGSAEDCLTPVVFDLPKAWEPDAVDASTDDTRTRPDLLCEVDGKPAGTVGFIRLSIDETPDGDAKAELQAHASESENPHDVEYREVKVGGQPGWEVSYLFDVPEFDEENRSRSFAVVIGGQLVRVDLDAPVESYVDVLPAYLLARDTLTTRR